jgi:hypothetical protein
MTEIKVPTIGKHYDTVTVPALRALQRAAAERRQLADDGVAWWAELEPVKAAVDAAAAAGATPSEIADAVGGRDAWNALVRALKAEGLV